MATTGRWIEARHQPLYRARSIRKWCPDSSETGQRWMKPKRNTDSTWRIEAVIDHIETHLDEPLSVEALSEIAAFSPFHFHRQFSAHVGMPVYRMVQLLRLKRASRRLAFEPEGRIIDVAIEAGFDSHEAFSRAFKRVFGQSPAAFRRAPHWDRWWEIFHHFRKKSDQEIEMPNVTLVDFPTTRIAKLRHRGPEHTVYATTRRFIDWRRRVGLAPGAAATYGLHHAGSTLDEYIFDVAAEYDRPVADNPEGVTVGEIPGGRCALVRHVGSREHIPAADWLYREWLPASGEALRDCPFFFHYVNVGPDVAERDMVTDLYLPLE